MIRLALGIKLALDRLVPSLARVASPFVALREWIPFGYARVDDFTRERSRGGDEQAESNQTTACRFHHQMGEHGVFASCRGEAPLGIVWRLGREELATWFRNELRVSG
jgi:hypothetical protein